MRLLLQLGRSVLQSGLRLLSAGYNRSLISLGLILLNQHVKPALIFSLDRDPQTVGIFYRQS